MVGTWIQLFAQSWLVYRITGSATALGLIAFASQAPMLLLSPVTGVIVERLDTRRLLLASGLSRKASRPHIHDDPGWSPLVNSGARIHG